MQSAKWSGDLLLTLPYSRTPTRPHPFSKHLTVMTRNFWKRLCLIGLLVAAACFVVFDLLMSVHTRVPASSILAFTIVMYGLEAAFALGVLAAIVGGIGWAARARKSA
jgi:hypothetical protein